VRQVLPSLFASPPPPRVGGVVKNDGPCRPIASATTSAAQIPVLLSRQILRRMPCAKAFSARMITTVPAHLIHRVASGTARGSCESTDHLPPSALRRQTPVQSPKRSDSYRHLVSPQRGRRCQGPRHAHRVEGERHAVRCNSCRPHRGLFQLPLMLLILQSPAVTSSGSGWSGVFIASTFNATVC
jgi:hypothetical protein